MCSINLYFSTSASMELTQPTHLARNFFFSKKGLARNCLFCRSAEAGNNRLCSAFVKRNKASPSVRFYTVDSSVKRCILCVIRFLYLFLSGNDTQPEMLRSKRTQHGNNIIRIYRLLNYLPQFAYFETQRLFCYIFNPHITSFVQRYGRHGCQRVTLQRISVARSLIQIERLPEQRRQACSMHTTCEALAPLLGMHPSSLQLRKIEECV